LKRHFKSGSVSSIGSGRYWAIDRNGTTRRASSEQAKNRDLWRTWREQVPWVCHRIGMDYVSCSPFRVPIARLAAAQPR
jgi:hypothetical protein